MLISSCDFTCPNVCFSIHACSVRCWHCPLPFHERSWGAVVFLCQTVYPCAASVRWKKTSKKKKKGYIPACCHLDETSCALGQHDLNHLLTAVIKSCNDVLEALINCVRALWCDFLIRPQPGVPAVKTLIFHSDEAAWQWKCYPRRSMVPGALIPHHYGRMQPLSILTVVMVFITISPMWGRQLCKFLKTWGVLRLKTAKQSADGRVCSYEVRKYNISTNVMSVGSGSCTWKHNYSLSYRSHTPMWHCTPEVSCV